jgi:LAS superfamily LD-carboxypeptidase LdcB
VLEPSDVPASGASESAYTPGDEPVSMMPPVRPPQSELDGARSRQAATEAPSSSHARMREFVVRGKRETIVDGLDKTFAERLERMVDAMPPEIRRGFQIGSAYRSVEEQRVLYNRAVAKYGSERIARRWAAPPGRSYHNHGKAVDLRFGSQEVRDWVHSNARRFQMYFPMGHEPWHMEPLGTRGTKDRVAFNFDGDTEDNTA